MLAKKRILLGVCVTSLLLMLMGCASTSTQQSSDMDTPLITDEAVAGEPRESATDPVQTEAAAPPAHAMETERALPVRYQRPSYFVSDLGGDDKGTVEDEETSMMVGADIVTQAGPATLREIMKQLASLHNMNISWSSDVDQYAYIDADIRADEDFYKAIENMLRQVDYFHEVEGNTIIIKFKETRKFHVALPPRIKGTSNINTSGGTTTNVESDTTRWDSIRRNLDQVLDIWAQRFKAPPSAKPSDGDEEDAPKPQGATLTQTSSGFYSIDPSLGLITVTAPRPLLDKVELYIDDLKEEMYRQITIEAKILEVQLDHDNQSGIDWSELLSSSAFNFTASFGNNPGGVIYENDSFNTFLDTITLEAKNFSLILDAMQTYGDTRVLANPRISVMNGQPAVIYVGDNVTYISEVETTTDEGTVTTSATTAQAISGLKLEVYATIMDDDEIILSLIPMISRLTQPIEYRTFGLNQIGLPEIAERTMNSIVRLKNGEMLVVGGLISTAKDNSGNKVMFLGDLPGLQKVFGKTGETSLRRELVILLKPTIL